MHWMIEPLRRYADFTGRSRRQEFWMFFLFQTLVVIGILSSYGVFAAVGVASESALVAVPILIWGLFALAMLVPNAAVIVRRFHDQDMSGVIGGVLYGGMWLFNPLGLILLIFMCIDGKPSNNQYGPDPKGRGVNDIFS